MTVATTPTGVLLGTYTPGTPEWEAARAGLCITATEIAAVVGLSPSSWSTEYVLWHKKAGHPVPPFQMQPHIEWGLRLEPAVLEKYREDHPDCPTEAPGTWRHRDRDWQRATPDRVAPDRVVESKTAPFGGDGWGPDGSDEIPIHYRCQVMWQMDTLGLPRADIPVLLSGWDYRVYTVEYDETEAAFLRTAAADFLERVRRGERPDPDGSDVTYATARLQSTGRDEIEVDIGPHLAEQYRTELAAQAALEERRRRISCLILQRLGNARYATSLGERVAIRTVRPDGTTRSLMPVKTKETH